MDHLATEHGAAGGESPDLGGVDEILERYGAERPALIMMLQEIQERYRYLPRWALRRVSERMEVPLSEVVHTASFYRAFSLEPKGRIHLSVCTGTACHVRGAAQIIDALERELGVPVGATTEDGQFSMSTVNCVGACALAPVVMVNDDAFHGHLQVTRMGRFIETLRRDEEDES